MTILDEQSADPVGPPSKGLRQGDLVLTEDPRRGHALGKVTGAYQLGGEWFIQLATPPGRGQPRPPQSTKSRYITEVYRRPRPKRDRSK